MLTKSASPAIITDHVDESRDFYQKYLGAQLVFDCGWFINLEFTEGLSVQFMAPQEGMTVCDTRGLTYNFAVENVDAEHARLLELGLKPQSSPEDHPWGDRGFTIVDPSGVDLYIYTDIEPSAEFKAAFLKK